MVKVRKRNGDLVPFDITRIEKALKKAFSSCDITVSDETIYKIATSIEIWNEIKVEDIQDQVEEVLMDFDFPVVAKEYILYRYKHNLLRRGGNELSELIASKLEAINVQNQNANLDEYSFGGRIGEASSIVTKEYALENCMSKMARNNHLNNEIYIHDLDSYAVGLHNCLTVPFDDLLSKGFKTRQVDIRPANSINTAFQLLAVVFQIQSLQEFGGVSASHLDWTMVPYVRKSFYKHYKDGIKYILNLNPDWFKKLDINTPINSIMYNQKGYGKVHKYAFDMTKKELEQAVEGMYHNLNSLQSRSGCQLPFTSINYGTCTSIEGRMVIKALLEGCIKGVGTHHTTSIFPCGIFQYMKGVNDKPGTPNYDLYKLALKSTAKRMYPNYANVDWSVNAGYDKNDPKTYVSSMGCRTYNGYDINGLGQQKDGRGNICPVTIILPTLAMEAKGNIDEFFYILTKKITEAKDMLLERFEWICKQSPKSAKFMWENNTMAGYIPEEGIRSALKHGTLALGQLGLAETLQILIGKDHTTKEGMILAKRIENVFYESCKFFKEQYKLNFGVYFSPAESLCYTALKKFRDKYGIIPSVSDKEFFTNSIHVPVWKEVTPFEKIDIESQLTGYSNAGCITYIELDSSVKNNIEALETIVNYAMDKDIPYFAINVPNDICQDCGYCDEIGNSCPECGSNDILRLRRVTGYLSRDYRHFNLGKQDEVKHRVKHIKEIDE